MRVVLVAMPWSMFDMPSAALGALAPVLAEDGWEVVADHAFLDLFEAVGQKAYEAVSQASGGVGELFYLPLLYPERAQANREALLAWAETRGGLSAVELDQTLAAVAAHVQTVADRLVAGAYDLVGLTTSYAQLFASLAVAAAVKRARPETRVALGGAAVGWHLGAALLQEYPCIDVIVQGEGEARLLALVRHMGAGEVGFPTVDGILWRGEGSAATTEIPDLDQLPYPDYDAYADLADARALHWYIPMEGSRGCWWDRVKRTGKVDQTCYFCSLNTVRYREKSAARVGEEANALAERYRNLRIRFLDNVLRVRGMDALCDALESEGRSLSFFYEMRAQITAPELLRLWEAGCEEVQIGIEGLSTSYLRRIGKGTTAIQNLGAMRIAAELGLRSSSNLLTGFPGATEAEVAETVETIERFAMAYPPPDLSRFTAGVNSTVWHLPERFGVSRLRNSDRFAPGLPAEVYRRLPLFWISFDADGVNWAPVEEAVARWVAQSKALPALGPTVGTRPLVYQDGRTFLEIIDRRHGFRTVTLGPDLRAIYLAAMEVRSRSALHAALVPLSPSDIDEHLGALVEANLMAQEGERFLSLAIAPRPEIAARRIRAETQNLAMRADPRAA